jgi:translocation protein SEC63
VFLLVKLRLSPPGVAVAKKDLSVEDISRIMQANNKIDEQFLTSRLDAEDLDESLTNASAHAPFWPGVSTSVTYIYETCAHFFILILKTRKPSWWIVLADDKSNRVVVPPLKISDIPYSSPDTERDYRAYKIQFQCPPNTGLFTWKVYIVSDTFVGDEATIDLPVSSFFAVCFVTLCIWF